MTWRHRRRAKSHYLFCAHTAKTSHKQVAGTSGKDRKAKYPLHEMPNTTAEWRRANEVARHRYTQSSINLRGTTEHQAPRKSGTRPEQETPKQIPAEQTREVEVRKIRGASAKMGI